MKTQLRRLSPWDCEYVHMLREADLSELKAQGLDPEECIVSTALSPGNHFTGFHNGVFACFIGVTDCGVVWAMTTQDYITKYPRAFHKTMLRGIKFALRRHETIGNYVWSGNTIHIAWLKRLGFTFDFNKPSVAQVTNEIFYPFYKTRSSCVIQF